MLQWLQVHQYLLFNSNSFSVINSWFQALLNLSIVGKVSPPQIATNTVLFMLKVRRGPVLLDGYLVIDVACKGLCCWVLCACYFTCFSLTPTAIE